MMPLRWIGTLKVFFIVSLESKRRGLYLGTESTDYIGYSMYLETSNVIEGTG